MHKISPVTRRLALLLLAAAGIGWHGVAASAAPAAVAPLPVEAFFKNPALGRPALSPSGKKIAMVVPTESGRLGLAVADVATPDKFVGIAQFPDADVQGIAWVNDTRLVFAATDRQAALGDQLGTGLYAVDADGSDFLWLIKRANSYTVSREPARPPLPNRYRFVSPIHDGSDDVLVARWVWVQQGTPPTMALVRLNTKALTTRAIHTGAMPPDVQGGLVDPDLQLRVAIANDGDKQTTVYWRDANSTSWSELYRFDAIKDIATEPVAVDKAGQLYVAAVNRESGDGTTALYRYDVKQRKIEDKPLVSLPGFDFAGAMKFDSETKQLLGVSYYQEARGMLWFEPKMRALQETIDKLLPATNNDISCSRCMGARHLVVTASSDIQAPVYFLFDRETAKLSLLGASRPWLDSSAMAGTQDFQRIKARDGMDIPVYITKPKGKGPWPTVVMVHGGPYVRGVEWGFNTANQFLASRGYVVIEPEFRGSTGYGSKLFRSGWKQWGLGMQDDITDATRWAIAQGLADPKRIAIAGASYGGYATMMGLLKEPDLYKAGVNWVGVTDIDLLYTIGWSDIMNPDSPWVRYGMPLMIGDPKKDAAQLAATSPLKQAHRIKQPVLMAYGEEDLRVPLPHGVKMRDALVASGNRNVEWIQYKGEGHGWNLERNNVDFWNRVERFLASHLK